MKKIFSLMVIVGINSSLFAVDLIIPFIKNLSLPNNMSFTLNKNSISYTAFSKDGLKQHILRSNFPLIQSQFAKYCKTKLNGNFEIVSKGGFSKKAINSHVSQYNFCFNKKTKMPDYLMFYDQSIYKDNKSSYYTLWFFSSQGKGTNSSYAYFDRLYHCTQKDNSKQGYNYTKCTQDLIKF